MLSYLCRLLRALSLQNIYWIFCQTCLSHHGWGKISHRKFLFSSNLNTISQKIEYRYFYRCLRRLNSPLGSYQHHLGRRKLLIPPQAAFFQEFIFPQQKGSGEETMINISYPTHIIIGKGGSKHPLNPSIVLNHQLPAKSNPSVKISKKKTKKIIPPIKTMIEIKKLSKYLRLRENQVFCFALLRQFSRCSTSPS